MIQYYQRMENVEDNAAKTISSARLRVSLPDKSPHVTVFALRQIRMLDMKLRTPKITPQRPSLRLLLKCAPASLPEKGSIMTSFSLRLITAGIMASRKPKKTPSTVAQYRR